jgi:hypothetical protein
VRYAGFFQIPEPAAWHEIEAVSKAMGEPIRECRDASSAVELQRQGST